MKKYNNYKKYYETHKEQEKQRLREYYAQHREEILIKQREKRKNMPKVKKLTLKERLKLYEKALYLATEQISEFQFGCEEFNMCQLCSNWYTDAENCADIECEEGYANYFLQKAKEQIEEQKSKNVVCDKCGCILEVQENEDFTYCPMCENDQVEINLSYESKVLNNFFKKQNNEVVKDEV